jgi:hypothetical protein
VHAYDCGVTSFGISPKKGSNKALKRLLMPTQNRRTAAGNIEQPQTKSLKTELTPEDCLVAVLSQLLLGLAVNLRALLGVR